MCEDPEDLTIGPFDTSIGVDDQEEYIKFLDSIQRILPDRPADEQAASVMPTEAEKKMFFLSSLGHAPEESAEEAISLYLSISGVDPYKIREALIKEGILEDEDQSFSPENKIPHWDGNIPRGLNVEEFHRWREKLKD